MSDVETTLQQLLRRRLREMGEERGRREPITLKEAHDALPRPGREAWASREAVRKVLVRGHTNIEGRTARTIAAMFGLSEGEVLQAAGKRAPLGRFELPEEADRLSRSERRAVLGVIEAILDAAEGRSEQPSALPPESPDGVVADLTPVEDGRARAARRGEALHGPDTTTGEESQVDPRGEP